MPMHQLNCIYIHTIKANQSSAGTNPMSQLCRVSSSIWITTALSILGWSVLIITSQYYPNLQAESILLWSVCLQLWPWVPLIDLGSLITSCTAAHPCIYYSFIYVMIWINSLVLKGTLNHGSLRLDTVGKSKFV